MIKFVYFDLGGVLVSDFSGNNKWNEMKKVMGVKKNFENEFDQLYDKYELEELCLTRPIDSLIPIFTEKFNMKFPDNFSMLTYFVDHFEINKSIWEAVKMAKNNFKIGILTNMYLGMFDEIRKRKLLPPVEWDVIIDSSLVNLQKPDLQIFKLATTKAYVSDQEILFIDNRMNNIEAAEALGWKTFFYDSSDQKVSSDKLKEYLYSAIK